MADNPAPPDSHEFDALMDAALDGYTPRAIAVAVSGGRDSMALALLMRAWGDRHKTPVSALTVDHGLRRESQGEAEQVAAWFSAMGLPHETLIWRGDKPETGVQDAARRARYGLMLDWCADHGVDVLCTAHHLEDQAETVLLRLSCGSGPDGLAGIPRHRIADGVHILRPLLGLGRTRLEATCVDNGQDWIDDPTNASGAYARGRLRKIMDVLAQEGMSPERLGRTAYRLSLVRAAMEEWTDEALDGNVLLFKEGYALLYPRGCRDLPRELRLRVLERTLSTVSGQEYPLRFDSLEALHDAVWARGGECRTDYAGRTLGGCVIQPFGNDSLLFVREDAAMAGLCPLADSRAVIWDGRFSVTRKGGGVIKEGFYVGRLGTAGVRELRDLAGEGKWDGYALEALPGVVRTALPAIFWGREQVYAVPLLDYTAPQGVDSGLEFETTHCNSGKLPLAP